jgi:hypothetical protein
MTVKLSLLKSGEDVIADIQEMVIEDRVVGYFFNNPCIVKVLAKNYDESGNQTKTPCQLQLTPWMPLTNDDKIPVSPDWVVTIVEPMPQLKEMYEKGVLKNVKNDQDSSTDKQSDSDQSD